MLVITTVTTTGSPAVGLGGFSEKLEIRSDVSGISKKSFMTIGRNMNPYCVSSSRPMPKRMDWMPEAASTPATSDMPMIGIAYRARDSLTEGTDRNGSSEESLFMF